MLTAERNVTIHKLPESKIGCLPVILDAKFIHCLHDTIWHAFPRRPECVIVEYKISVNFHLIYGCLDVAHNAFITVIAIYIYEVKVLVWKGIDRFREFASCSTMRPLS